MKKNAAQSGFSATTPFGRWPQTWPPQSFQMCDNLRERKHVWTLLEAFLLPAWNVAFRRGTIVFSQYPVSNKCLKGATEPDNALDWRVKHLRKHRWRCCILEGTRWKTEGDSKSVDCRFYIPTNLVPLRRRAKEVGRARCLPARGNRREKWPAATFAAAGKR